MNKSYLDMEEIEKLEKIIKTSFNWRRFWLIIATVLGVFVLAFFALAGYVYSYNEKVFPGLYLGKIPIGGMQADELRSFIEKMNDKMVSDGINFKYAKNGEMAEKVIYPTIVSDGSSLEMVRLDVDAEIDYLIGYKKVGGILERMGLVLQSRFYSPVIKLHNIEIDEKRLLESLQQELSQYEVQPQDANIKIIKINPLEYEIVSSTPGVLFDYADAVNQVKDAWSSLEIRTIEVKKTDVEPKIMINDVKSIENRLTKVLTNDGLLVQYTDPHTNQNYEWKLDISKIQSWFEVQKVEDEVLGFGLDKDQVTNFLNTEIVPTVDKESHDAKFSMNDKIVTEFQGSRPGIKLDLEKTYEQINDAILGRSWHDEGLIKTVQLVIDKVEPKVKIADVNDLGIKEVLAVGVSDFHGSTQGRIVNLKNAVKKLNGVLIAPGQEFSTVEHTKPFTIEGGYLPELVIKGDEIKKEIGGGLCQIGTTLFRMAMNGGLNITSRRNHSLVVHYYNDPVNGNPGTDATVYDPAPDFKFKNDTGHYILIQTQIDVPNTKLYFTLWGTSDGRKGYYNHPTVLRWIPYGEKKIIETTNLPPGKTECQTAYIGADTTFTYTRELPGKDKEEIIYESHYRPLPQICLLGVETVVATSTEQIVTTDSEVPVVVE